MWLRYQNIPSVLLLELGAETPSHGTWTATGVSGSGPGREGPHTPRPRWHHAGAADKFTTRSSWVLRHLESGCGSRGTAPSPTAFCRTLCGLLGLRSKTSQGMMESCPNMHVYTYVHACLHTYNHAHRGESSKDVLPPVGSTGDTPVVLRSLQVNRALLHPQYGR